MTELNRAVTRLVEEGAGPAAASGPEPLGVEVALTGNLEVDSLIGRLGDADDLRTENHIEVYEDVHQKLRAALTALDENNDIRS